MELSNLLRNVFSSITTCVDMDPLRPFHIEIPEEALADLRRRIAATN